MNEPDTPTPDAVPAPVQSPPRPVLSAPVPPEDPRTQLLGLADEARRKGSRHALHAYLAVRNLLISKK